MKDTYFTGYKCIDCGKTMHSTGIIYLCDICGKKYKVGEPLIGVLEAYYDYDKIGEEWEKCDKNLSNLLQLFSPVAVEYFPEIPVGNTPFYQSLRLSSFLQNKGMNLESVWIKNDALNPSGSLKDRASYTMTAEAKKLGVDKIVTASTGNAASALAAMAAAAGIKAVIFVPAGAPPAKIAQIKIHGAELIKVDGDYDKAFAQSLEYTAKHGGLNRNTAYHPFTIEGKKTVSLEIFIQNNYKVPEWIVVPVGDGVILTGVYKGFADLKRAGITDKMPRLLAVQADSSDAIVNYWESNKYRNAIKPDTIADSISVSAPSNARWARKLMIETNSKGVLVTDEEIMTAQKELAQTTGVFAEPAASASLAGLKTALKNGIIQPTEQTVLLITGHGLKAVNFNL